MKVQDMKVVLCDDSLLVRKKLKDHLTTKGFTSVWEASDGEEAVEVCRNVQPDIVFLDIVMPRKDGLEALQEIKELSPNTRVIMASSTGTQAHLIKALKLGAANFLQKPIAPNAVLEQILKIYDERSEG